MQCTTRADPLHVACLSHPLHDPVWGIDPDLFYANDPALTYIARIYRIDFRKRLSEIIEQNTGVDVGRNVFKAPA